MAHVVAPLRSMTLTPRRALPPLAGLVTLWGVQALSVTAWMRAYQFADDDTGLAVRMARACLEHGTCPSAGMPTSGLGLSHGASWIRLIGWCLTTDGSLGTLQAIVLALLVAAVVVTGVVVWRTVSWRAAVFASLLVLPATMATYRFDDLTNGTIAPLPLALFFAGLVWCVHSGGLVPAVGAGIALALAMSTSLSSILLAPLLLALVALAARQAVVAVVLAAGAIAATFAIESSTAAAQLAGALARPAALGLGVVVLVTVAATVVPAGRMLLGRVVDRARAGRGRFRDVPPTERLRVAMRLAALYLIAAGWAASVPRLRLPDAHYFATAVFPLVFLAADAAEALSRRVAAILVGTMVLALASMLFAPLAVGVGSVLCVVTALVVSLRFVGHVLRARGANVADLAPRAPSRVAAAGVLLVCLMSAPDALFFPRTRQIWPVVTAETMVRRLYASGFTYAELMTALQGQAPYTLQAMAASLDPAFSVDPPMAEAPTALLTMIVDAETATRTADALVRLDTAHGDAAIAVRAESVLDRGRLRTCYARACDEPIDPHGCSTRDPRGSLRHDRPYFPVTTPAGADATPSGGPPIAHAPGSTWCMRFFVPLRTSGSGEPHWLRVPELWPLQARIRAVSGVAFDGPLPGLEVRIANDARAAGTVEVEVAAHGLGPESDWLEEPPLVEVQGANEQLLEPFRQGRVTPR